MSAIDAARSRGNRKLQPQEIKRMVLARAVGNCSCGQELDLCVRSHCPRCGRHLHR